MGPGTRFQPVISDATDGASKVLLCSGKHYYTLKEAVDKDDLKDVALIRVEELSPFPSKELADALSQHPPSAQVVWAQEEPANQGAWSYVRPRVDELLSERGSEPVVYAGRAAGATTAVGVGAWHKLENAQVVESALD